MTRPGTYPHRNQMAKSLILHHFVQFKLILSYFSSLFPCHAFLHIWLPSPATLNLLGKSEKLIPRKLRPEPLELFALCWKIWLRSLLLFPGSYHVSLNPWITMTKAFCLFAVFEWSVIFFYYSYKLGYLVSFKNTFCFQEAALGSQQNWMEGTKGYNLCTPVVTTSPSTNVACLSSACAVTCELVFNHYSCVYQLEINSATCASNFRDSACIHSITTILSPRGLKWQYADPFLCPSFSLASSTPQSYFPPLPRGCHVWELHSTQHVQASSFHTAGCT